MVKLMFSAVCSLLLVVNSLGDGSWINIDSGTHNLILCTATDGELAYQEHVKIEAKIFKVNTYNINFPNGVLNDKSINCIKVIDRVSNKRGGWVSIVSGGVGYHNVLIQLMSQKSRPMEFDVEIWTDIV